MEGECSEAFWFAQFDRFPLLLAFLGGTGDAPG